MKIYNFFLMPHPPIMIPEVGKGEEKKIQSTVDACTQVGESIANIAPDTLILITPHGPMFSDAVAISNEAVIQGDLSGFGVPQVSMEIQIDTDFTDRIIEQAGRQGLPVVPINRQSAQKYSIRANLDHGSLVPLYYIRKKYRAFKLIHITYGMLSKEALYQLGEMLQQIAQENGRRTVMVASGDLSHRLLDSGPYDYSPYGIKFDKEILAKLSEGDVQGIMDMDPTMVEEAGQCGLRSIYIMLGAMKGLKIHGEILSYEGTFGVGYGVMRFALDPYVQLAKDSLAYYLDFNDYMEIPKDIPEEIKNSQGAVFVTLHKNRELRGCIGTILPTRENVAQEIIHNAVSAGLHDPRFMPVSKEELGEIEFSVDVLTLPEPADRSELDPQKYGVIVGKGSRRGLLLPDIDGVDTIEEQLRIALAKGGISPDENYTIEKFAVVRHI